LRGEDDERSLLCALPQRLDAGFVDLDRREHPRGGAGEGAVERPDRVHVERGFHLAEHPERALGDDGALVCALAGHVGDDLLKLRAAYDLGAEAVRRLLHRADDRAALALEAAQESIRQAADEDVVAGDIALAREELLQVDGLAGAQRRVAPVGEELHDRPDVPGPFGGPEEGVADAPVARVRAARPDEGLRDEEDGLVAPPLHVEERANQAVPLDLAARAALEQVRRALEEERRAAADGEHALEVRRVAVGRTRAQRVAPPAPHRLEHP